VLEDDVGRVAEDFPDPLGKGAGGLEPLPLLLLALAAAAHHPRELGAIDVAGGAELDCELALGGGRDDSDRGGSSLPAELRGEDAEPAGPAPDQHPVTGSQAALVDEHPVGGEVGHPVRGRIHPGEGFGLGE
jgi:hypothetical protein